MNTDPMGLLEEIKAGITLRDRHWNPVETLHSKYVSSHWKAGGPAEYDPENHPFEYISYVVPKLVYKNPKARVQSRRPGWPAAIAPAYQDGLNRWIAETNLVETLTELAVDFTFCLGVAVVDLEDNPTLRGVKVPENVEKNTNRSKRKKPRTRPKRPRVRRMGLDRYFRDPAARSWQDAIFKGHTEVRQKEDLLEEARANPDAGWNIQAIEELSAVSDSDKLGRSSKDTPNRNEVVFHVVWVRDHEGEGHPGKDKGYHGTLFWVAENANQGDQDPKFIRDPQPFYGPAWGPYVDCFAAYVVPGEAWPLSPLQAVAGQADDLNRVARAMTEQGEDYWRGVFADTTVADFVSDRPSGTVFGIEGFDPSKALEVAVGGIAPELLQDYQVRRERLERVSGYTDAQRGEVSGQGTATEIAIADAASSVRIDWLKERYTAAVQWVLKTVCWYMYYDDRVLFPLGPNGYTAGPASGDGSEMWFDGGDHDPESGYTFEDLEVAIEVYSMERVNEGMMQQRSLQAFTLVAQVAPLIPQTPFVRWDWLFEKLGESFNMDGFAQVIDMQGAQSMMGMQPEGAPGGSGPRLAGDVGGRGASPGRPPAMPAMPQTGGVEGNRTGQQALNSTRATNAGLRV